MKKMLTTVLVLTALTGCGTTAGPNAAHSPVSAASASKKAVKLNQPSYDKGLAAGIAKAAGKDVKATQPKQDLAFDQTSYDYGFVIGLLTGSINSYGRINGSFDVYEWKTFCYMNVSAMKDALAAIQASKGLEARYGLTAGILLGGIQSFERIGGNFDVYQWKSFAETNRGVLNSALDSLKSNPLK